MNHWRKREGEREKDGAAALIPLFAICPSSVFFSPSVLFHASSVPYWISGFSIVLVLLMSVYREFMKKDGEGERGKRDQKANETVLFSFCLV